MSDQPATIEGVDFAVLDAWMSERGLASGPISNVHQLTGGTQNILVRFDRGGVEYVLRRPPLHKRRRSDDIMRREAKILAALASTDVPHPRLLAACEDTDVMGAAFYLMEPINGANPVTDLPDSYRSDPSWRMQLGLAMADGAAAIGSVDHVALDLSDLGRPDGFLERQVDRWRHELDSYQELQGYDGPQIPEVVEVAAWLESNLPRHSQAGLMHGDFHLANVMVAFDRPALAGIVDWEMATIGDPLVDLGWLLATWPADDAPVARFRLDPWDNYPNRAQLIERYGERSTRDLADVDWYEVFACYKLGVVLEGTYARACAGLADPATGRRLHESAVALLARGSRRIDRL